MPLEITMPQLGLTMETGTIAKWLVAAQDAVVEGQPLVEIETDKAVVAMESPRAGILARIVAPEGAEVPVGATIAVLVQPGEELPADMPAGGAVQPKAGKDARAESPAPAVATVQLPSGEFQASWKARIAAREAGIEIGGIAGTGPGGRVTAVDVSRAVQSPKNPPTTSVKVSPSAERLARLLGLDVSVVQGTGSQGRIMEEDVLKTAAAVIQSARTGHVPKTPQAASAPAAIPLKGVRALVSQRMADSAKAAARVTLFREVDAAGLVAFRERYRAQGIEITYNDILVRACAAALREHPAANARLGDGKIEQGGSVNIGIAVDTERGLLVPVIRDADTLSISEIAAASARLIQEARSGRIAPDSLAGGTFTLTNLGMFGVDGFTPIINLPECCILGVGRIVRKPVVCDEDESIVVRPMLTLSLSFDHRVIDGAPAARFLDRIAQFVQDPWLLAPLP